MTSLQTTALIALAMFTLPNAVFPQVRQFDVYTFQRDASLRIGYPQGWTVTEAVDDSGTALSAVISRSNAPDSEGFIFFLIPYPADTALADSRQFAGQAISQLRTSSLPNLVVDKEYPHSNLEQIHVSELSLESGGVRFNGRSWGALLKSPGGTLGVFALFYGPPSTFGQYNPDELLAGLIAPIFSAPPTSPAAPGGALDPRFFGTWALHTTVAADTMMQENSYHPDGTFVIRQYASGPMMSTSPYGRGSASQTLRGTWRIEDGNFHLRWQDGGAAVYSFRFEGQFLEMRGVNVRETLKFRKVDR